MNAPKEKEVKCSDREAAHVAEVRPGFREWLTRPTCDIALQRTRYSSIFCKMTQSNPMRLFSNCLLLNGARRDRQFLEKTHISHGD